MFGSAAKRESKVSPPSLLYATSSGRGARAQMVAGVHVDTPIDEFDRHAFVGVDRIIGRDACRSRLISRLRRGRRYKRGGSPRTSFLERWPPRCGRTERSVAPHAVLVSIESRGRARRHTTAECFVARSRSDITPLRPGVAVVVAGCDKHRVIAASEHEPDAARVLRIRGIDDRRRVADPYLRGRSGTDSSCTSCMGPQVVPSSVLRFNTISISPWSPGPFLRASANASSSPFIARTIAGIR